MVKNCDTNMRRLSAVKKNGKHELKEDGNELKKRDISYSGISDDRINVQYSMVNFQCSSERP
jgi:hypothetical protein